MMRKGLLAIGASIALLAAGSLASSAAETKAGAVNHKRITRHHNVAHPGRDITSFSSLSVLHIGVNHPPKNR
jgi:Skp family chaperone for outer membrane proteins